MNTALVQSVDAAPGPRAVVRESMDFAVFAASMQQIEPVTDVLASPALALAWAKAIGSFWMAEQAAGRLDPRAPLPVVDLAPGSGRFARLMLQALRRWLAQRMGAAWRLYYLACVAPGMDLARWATDSGLARDDGVDAVIWDPAHRGAVPPSLCAPGGQGTGNPVAVLALGYLQQFPGALRAVHYGQWLQGRVRRRSEGTQGCRVEYEWAPMSGSEDAALPEALRRRYLDVLGSAWVRVPDAPLRALRTIARISAGRFLWLAADRGIVSEKQIRFGGLMPSEQWTQANLGLPVNFHALACVQAMQGAWTHHSQLGEDGIVVQAIWRHDGTQPASVSYRVLAEHLETCHPDHVLRYIHLAASLAEDPDTSLRLALLHASGYDPEIVRPVLRMWADAPPPLPDTERHRWGEALMRIWEHSPRSRVEAAFRHDLGVLAARWNRLDLARAIFTEDANATCLALCDALAGRLDHALCALRGAASADAFAVALQASLEARHHHWQSLGWYRADAAREGSLTLEPLGEEHAEALFNQYRDPQIGELTRLPELDTVEAAQEWISAQGEQSGRATYAVMHADAGFVGVVSLHASGENAYFYFWIGCDHQGRGYGRRAGGLLQAQAKAFGVKRLFTSVYRDNRRSLEALAELGFVPLAVQARSSDEDMLFLMNELTGAGVSTHAGALLASLLATIDSPIHLQVVAPENGGDIFPQPGPGEMQ